MINDIKVVAFDCDGVMFDSAAANVAYYNSILDHFTMPKLSQEQFAYTHMHTVDESLAYLFKATALLDEARAFRKTMSYLPFIRHMEVEPNLKPLLKRLRPGFKTAVATNRTDTMNRVLVDHDLEDLFDLVVSAMDVDRPKPHPDCILKVVNHFNVTPRQVVYIGDSELDEVASREAGVHFVAFANTGLKADAHIDSLKQMEPILGLETIKEKIAPA